MELVLHYEGPLPSGGDYQLQCKHHIRRALHRQLAMFCEAQRQGPYWPWVLTVPALPRYTLKGNEIQFPQDMKYGVVPVGPYHCVPLVTRKSDQIVEIRIYFYRREERGAIVRGGGDLDNRLKTLFDALRMPHYENEITATPEEGSDNRLYCLLEDDSLISGIAVETHRLWEAPQQGGRDTDVRLAIHVRIEPND